MDAENKIIAGTYQLIGKLGSGSGGVIYLMRKYGIINGVGQNKYEPKGFVTRASVAQIFRNFIDVMVKNK